MLTGCLLTGPKLTPVVKIHAVGDLREPARGARLLHPGEKLVLAMKASLAVISAVIGILEFAGVQNLDRYIVFGCEGQGCCQLGPRKRVRVGYYREHLLPKRLVGRIRQVR